MLAHVHRLLLCVGLLAGCGGGDSASRFDAAQGPINGLGSFFVAGTAWSLSGTGSATIDGAAAAETELLPGMVADVTGFRLSGGTTGNATRVTVDEAAEGPVDTLADLGDELFFNAFGQGFVVDRTTVFDGTDYDTFAGAGLGRVVRVFGVADEHPSQGAVVRVTRLEDRAATATAGTTRIQLEGTASSASSGSFDVGAITVALNDIVNCSGLTSIQGLGGSVGDGEAVEVDGRFIDASNVCALTVGERDAIEAVNDARREGFVTAIATNPTSFTLGSLPVDASTATLAPANLVLEAGMRLQVDGRQRSDVFTASAVTLRSEIEIDALVDGVSGTDLVVLGRTFATNADTHLDPGFPGSGDFVQVHAVEDGTGGFTATSIIDLGTADHVRIRARATDLNGAAQRATVLGDSIAAEGSATCRDASDAVVACAGFFTGLDIGVHLDLRDDDAPFDAFGLADRVDREP